MRCPYCNHITDDDSMFCASCGRKIEPRGNTYQHTTEMPKMSLYEDDFDMEEERKGKSSSSSVPVIIAIIIAVCLLITAGVAAWFLLNHRTDTSSDNSVSNELKTELNESTNKKIKEEKEVASKDIKKKWIQKLYQISGSKRGKVIKLFNGKGGFIQADQSYYFQFKNFFGKSDLLKIDDCVEFIVVNSYDKKRQIGTKEAVAITPIRR